MSESNRRMGGADEQRQKDESAPKNTIHGSQHSRMALLGSNLTADEEYYVLRQIRA